MLWNRIESNQFISYEERKMPSLTQNLHDVLDLEVALPNLLVNCFPNH